MSCFEHILGNGSEPRIGTASMRGIYYISFQLDLPSARSYRLTGILSSSGMCSKNHTFVPSILYRALYTCTTTVDSPLPSSIFVFTFPTLSPCSPLFSTPFILITLTAPPPGNSSVPDVPGGAFTFTVNLPFLPSSHFTDSGPYSVGTVAFAYVRLNP